MMEKNRFSPKASFLAVLVILFAIASCDRPSGKSQAGASGGEQHATVSGKPAIVQALGGTAISDAAEKTIDSVVNISSTRIVKTSPGSGFPFDDPFFRRFFGPDTKGNQPREQRQSSLGSGVIVDGKGTILTNNHVVEGADELRITLNDNRTFTAKVIGTDPSSDLAVIQIKEKADNLKPLSFGDSDNLRLGEIVLAIGSPFGLDHTVTMGIVSAKGRSRVGLVDYEDFIQTDAAINPGNSGGALINLRGELVGINTAIASRTGGSQGVGFAIPSNMARTIMEGLEDKGKIVRGWLGVYIKDITPDIADAMGLKSIEGVLIDDVAKDSPGKKAGLTHGDVILSVNGEKMESTGKLKNSIAMLGANTAAKIRVLRNGREREVTVRLAERAKNIQKASAEQEDKQALRDKALDGLTIAPLNRETRQTYTIPADVAGVVVIQVDEGSPAQIAGLRPGDVIREIGHRTVNSVDGFTGEYRKAKDKVLLYVYRDGVSFFTVLRK